MDRTVEEIIADFDALTPADFDEADVAGDGWERLDQLCQEIGAVNGGVPGAPALFYVMERLADVDLGTPGPLVHTLELWPRLYERYLEESIRRKPTPLTVWMVNRILNVRPPNTDMWLTLLRNVAEHPQASAATKTQASEFMTFQRARESGRHG